MIYISPKLNQTLNLRHWGSGTLGDARDCRLEIKCFKVAAAAAGSLIQCDKRTQQSIKQKKNTVEKTHKMT